MMLSKCSICNNKKPTFVSEGSDLLDNLALNTPQNRMKNSLWNALIKDEKRNLFFSM